MAAPASAANKASVAERNRWLTGKSLRDMLPHPIRVTPVCPDGGVHQYDAGIIALGIEKRETAVSAGAAIVPINLAGSDVQPPEADLHAGQRVAAKLVR